MSRQKSMAATFRKLASDIGDCDRKKEPILFQYKTKVKF